MIEKEEDLTRKQRIVSWLAMVGPMLLVALATMFAIGIAL